MSDVENGSRRLDVVQLFDLCDLLGIRIAELLEHIHALRSVTKKKRHR